MTLWVSFLGPIGDVFFPPKCFASEFSNFHLKQEVGDGDHFMGKESKPRHSLQFHWTNNILQARPFLCHSGFCWQLSVLAVLKPLVSTVLTLIFTFGSLASFSYLSAATGGDGLALMKDMLRKNGPLHFCPPETFISTALRLTNTNTGQIRCTSNAPHEYKCTSLKLHFCQASFISDRNSLWEGKRQLRKSWYIFFLSAWRKSWYMKDALRKKRLRHWFTSV